MLAKIVKKSTALWMDTKAPCAIYWLCTTGSPFISFYCATSCTNGKDCSVRLVQHTKKVDITIAEQCLATLGIAQLK
ncbi:hypothetical protein [Pasteurella oralis]|uniref:hypothetical protein n=1 Tax=Pasteurella oralis TaxID=1071947 RepID=UPI001FE50E27|nr:hypothetical protein [Pasteurella oralis]